MPRNKEKIVVLLISAIVIALIAFMIGMSGLVTFLCSFVSAGVIWIVFNTFVWFSDKFIKE